MRIFRNIFWKLRTFKRGDVVKERVKIQETMETENKYPKKPIFTKNKHSDGKEFLVAYSNCTSKSVISIGEKNLLVEGNPKICLRIGEGRFGEEIIFELLQTGPITSAPKRTKHNSIEIYLPKEYGIKFLKDAIKHFEENSK